MPLKGSFERAPIGPLKGCYWEDLPEDGKKTKEYWKIMKTSCPNGLSKCPESREMDLWVVFDVVLPDLLPRLLEPAFYSFLIFCLIDV